MRSDRYRYLVGLDCSIKQSGVAVYEPDTNKLELQSGTFTEVVKWLNEKGVLKQAIAVIEDPNLNSPLFIARRSIYSVLKRRQAGRCSEADVMTEMNILLKRAQHVGKAQAAAELFVQFFSGAGIPYLRIAPSDRMRADKPPRAGKHPMPVGMLVMPTKTTAYQFKTLTGYKGRSNEHARDAAMLVWGKSIEWAKSNLIIQREKQLI
ncbi:MAG: hypothetical protein D6706_20450 [Chloroflexi bacterium]|nr:MAG: hypothetical protein D6706_20450 [Chloroflexota bacterium]